MEGRQRGLFPGQEALPVLRLQSQRLRAELPGGLLVLLGRGEAAGQRGHEGGGERHALRQTLRQTLRQAGAEAALQPGDLRVVSAGQRLLQRRRRRRRRWLQHHGAVGHEHRVPGVDEVSRAGLRGPADQGVDAEGGGASEWPLHHHEGRTERRAHKTGRWSRERPRESRCGRPRRARSPAGSHRELRTAAIRSQISIPPSSPQEMRRFQEKKRKLGGRGSAPR